MPALTTAVSEGKGLTFEKGPVSFRAAGPPRNSLGRYLHGNESHITLHTRTILDILKASAC